MATMHPVYEDNTWSLKREPCFPPGLQCKSLRAPSTGDILLLPKDEVSELRQDGSCPGADEGLLVIELTFAIFWAVQNKSENKR